MDESILLDLLSNDLEGTQPDFPPPPELPPSLGYPRLLPDNRPKAKKYNQDLLALTPPHSTNIWDPRMVLDLALGVDDVRDILPRYGVTEAEFNTLSEHPMFRRELAMAMRDAREYGLPFVRKAKIQAESYLEVLDHMVYNELTPANVRLEAIRSTVRWAGLEPKEERGEGDGEKNVINVQINF